jgi:hypothetical protein
MQKQFGVSATGALGGGPRRAGAIEPGLRGQGSEGINAPFDKEAGLKVVPESLREMGLRLAHVNAAFTVLDGVMKSLQPVLETLQAPLRMIGELLGSTIAPVLRMLEVPLRLLATAASYVVEGFGRLIKGIGDFLNKILPGNPFKFLVNYGKEMIEGAQAARDSLDGVAAAADKFSESLSNVPTGYKIALARFNASHGAAMPTARGGVNIEAVYITSPDPKEVLRLVEQEAYRQAARGGTGLTLGYAG